MVRNVIIFSDPGEEIDDELALWKADEIFGSYVTRFKSYLYCLEQFNLHVVAVSGKIDPKDRINRCKAVIGMPKCITYWTPANFIPQLMSRSFVLIIGPLELDEYAENIISNTSVPDLVFLAGSIGQSVNSGSSEGAQNNCRKLLEISKQTVVLESGTLSQQKMTPSLLGEFPATVLPHVASLTWRFLLGRAQGPAAYVAHLASPSLAQAKQRPASNYEAVATVYMSETSLILSDTDISDASKKLAVDYAANHLEGLEEHCEQVGVPRDVVLREYSQLMEGLLQLGWYTDRVLLSGDRELSDLHLGDETGTAFVRFKNEIFPKIGSPLPCYDYNALREFLDYIK